MAASGQAAASAQVARVQSLLEPVIAEAGYVLEDITLTPAGRRRVLRVVVDVPPEVTAGLELDAVATIAHVVSGALDASSVMGATPYVLEVTSPGVDRPLTLPRHWARNRGRLVHADLSDGTTVRGRVRASDDDGVVLDVDGQEQALPWDRLRRGRVEVEFSRPDTAGDTGGHINDDIED